MKHNWNFFQNEREKSTASGSCDSACSHCTDDRDRTCGLRKKTDRGTGCGDGNGRNRGAGTGDNGRNR